MKILIVDDEPLLLRTMRRVLDNRDVVAAGGCGEARAQLNASTFDLVLTDWNMGDGCGSELYEQFGHDSSSRAPTFAFMSGESSLMLDAAAQRRLGCYILLKPFGRSELIGLVDKVALTRGQPPFLACAQ